MQKLAYFLLIALTLFAAQANSQDKAKIERHQKVQGYFPIVDYNESDVPTTEENRAQKEKQRRFNNLGNWVVARTQPYLAESVSSITADFPALPVAESNNILIGVVGERTAYLSENKRNVFTEITVAIETVFKTNNPDLQPGSVVAVHRMGGSVKYPNGQTVIYRRGVSYMPKTGGRYLFFLHSLNHYDYGILTAYALTEDGVIPLDLDSQFLTLDGIAETDILQRVRARIKMENGP